MSRTGVIYDFGNNQRCSCGAFQTVLVGQTSDGLPPIVAYPRRWVCFSCGMENRLTAEVTGVVSDQSQMPIVPSETIR